MHKDWRPFQLKFMFSTVLNYKFMMIWWKNATTTPNDCWRDKDGYHIACHKWKALKYLMRFSVFELLKRVQNTTTTKKFQMCFFCRKYGFQTVLFFFISKWPSGVSNLKVWCFFSNETKKKENLLETIIRWLELSLWLNWNRWADVILTT